MTEESTQEEDASAGGIAFVEVPPAEVTKTRIREKGNLCCTEFVLEESGRVTLALSPQQIADLHEMTGEFLESGTVDS